LKIPITQKRASGVAEGVDPKFKALYRRKEKKKTK
jgi:hypothetical protein